MIKKNNFILFGIIFVALLSSAQALSMPLSINGNVYDLDSGLPISERVHISVSNSESGFYVEGMTGTFFHPSRYSVSVDGQVGDDVVITVWNEFHSANIVVDLASSVDDANLYLNMTSTVQPNSPPEIVSTPVTEAFVNRIYGYDVEANDVDLEDSLSYRLIEKPSGMIIDQDTGLIMWIPALWQIGTHSVKVEVDDGRNGTDEQNFTVRVRWRPWVNENITYVNFTNVTFVGNPHPLILNLTGVFGLNRSFVLQDLSVENYSEDIFLVYSEGIKKPRGVKTAGRKVYDYMQLFALNLENGSNAQFSLVFAVDKEWYERKHVDVNRTALVNYKDRKWYPVDSEFLEEDDDFVYFIAHTQKLGHFAIVEGPRRTVQESQENTPFYVVGFVYGGDGEKQVDEDTPITIENLDRREVIEFETGIGPMSGAYAMILPGARGDRISISIDGTNRYSFALRDQENNIDFTRKRFGSGFNAQVHHNGELDQGILDYLRGLFG